MKKKLLDRRGAAIELAIMMMVFSIFITTILLTTALLQNSHKTKAELGIEQDIFLEQLGEDFVDAVLKGEMGADWKPENYEDVTIEITPIERHDWVKGELVAPSCEENGYTSYTCTLCGETKKEDMVPKKGHLVQGMNCESFVTGVCGNCHTEVTVRAEHNWSDWAVDTPATCYGKGTEKRICASCNLPEEKAIPNLQHNWGDGIAQAGKSCADEDGILYECAVCHEQKTERIAHSWDVGTQQDDKTCADEDGILYECAVCHEQRTERITHIWQETPETTRDASCTTAGEKIYQCSNVVCKATKIEEIPANGHRFENDLCTACGVSQTNDAYTLTVIAVDRNVYKTEVLNYVPKAEPCETAVLQIVLSWSETDNAYKITEWSKK